MDAIESPAEGSAFGRMFDVLAAPSEVFTQIKERPVEHSNWVIPAITWSIIGVSLFILLFSQDWALREGRKMQEKAMELKFDEMVKKGKMSQSDADNAKAKVEQFMDRYGGMTTKLVGSFFTVLGAFLVPFGWGFFIWLFGTKVFKADFEYMKAVEAAGLASVIYVLGVIVAILTSLAMGRITLISPAFFLQEFDPLNKIHVVLASLNPLYIWFSLVAACATAVLSGVSFGRAAAWIFLLWFGFRAIFIPLNLGQMVM